MEKLRIGMIGNGGISQIHAGAYYEEEDRVDVVGLCDIILERAEMHRDNNFEEAKVYTDYRELLKDESIDAVDICTPNYLHSQIAVDAFAAGKHVFCEKPDAISVEDAEKMSEASKKAGKLLMVMRNNRFINISRYAKKFIDDGNMGEIYAGRCGWIRRRGIPGKGGWFTTKELSGGGPLIDLGVHMIDLAVWLMGNPTPVAVSGSTYCKFADNDSVDSEHADFGDRVEEDGIFDVEDLAMGFIRFDNGAVLQIEFSWASNIEKETRFVELRGTKAGFNWNGDEIKVFTEVDGKQINDVIKSDSPTGGHCENLSHFIDVLQNGEKPCYEPQQGIDMIKILTAMYKSAEEGREIRL